MANPNAPTTIWSQQSINDAKKRSINAAMANLSPQNYTNFYSITAKYPNISKDLVMSMVNQGLTASTPGIGKIASLDGISQLKQDLMNVDKIKSTVKKDRGLVGSVMDTFANKIYDPFKGVSRAGFALLRMPYDFGTTLTRDIAAEKDPSLFLKDLATLGGSNTQFGSLIKDVLGGKPGVDTGAGFFIAPESRVGKDQAKAMSAYGKIAGESFTIGRWSAKSLGASPNTTAYRVMSGIVDATLNLAADPSTWLGPGAVSKIVGGGKKLSEMKALTKGLTQDGKLAANAEITKELKGFADGQASINQGLKTRTSNRFLKEQQELQRLETVKTKAIARVADTILNTERNVFKNADTDTFANEVLSTENISRWILGNEKIQTGELVKAVDRLSADAKNTGGFFDGYIIMDEIPLPGKISVGAHDLDEYIVTALDNGKKPVLLDLADDFAGASGPVKQAESARRTMLMQQFDDLSNDFTQTPEVRQAFDTLWQAMKADSQELGGPVGSLLFSENAETLGSLIAKTVALKNPEVTQKVSDAIQQIWQVDGFSNIRSIYGETGGIVITNTMDFLAANKAEIGNALAEFADPTNLGPNIAKFMESIKGTEDAIAKTNQKLEKAAKAQAEADQRAKDIDLLRELADNDPELLKNIVNDPDYQGLGKILDLPTGQGDSLAEYVRAQVGLTENYGGELGTDFKKVLQYMLGRRFAEIAEVVAAETDPARVRNFFGKRLDADMVVALTDANTSDDVYRIFLEHMGQETTDPRIFKSFSLRAEVGNLVGNPVAKLVDPVSLIPVKWAETIERSYSRYYVRSAVYNLGDLTGLTNGVEDWFSSAQIKTALGGRGQEELINGTIRKLFASTGNQERAKIIEDAMSEVVDVATTRLGLDAASRDELAKIIKISGSKEAKDLTAYSVNKLGYDEVPTVILAGDQTVALGGGIHEFQLLQDVVRLPDSREVVKALNNYTLNKAYGTAKAGKVLVEELGDVWRTAQLVFRMSYILRNIAEMQFRQMFSGHNSIFSHPMQFIAMVMANADKKNGLVTRVARYGTDLEGNAFKNADAEGELLDAVREAQKQFHRGASVSDYNSNRRSEIWKHYVTVDAQHEDFFTGLAYTLNRFASDKFDADIAKLMINGDDAAKYKYVQDLINNFDSKDSVIKDYILGVFNKNEGIRSIFLKDLGLENPNVKENLNPDNIFTFFFDDAQPHTLAGQIRSVVGTGPKSHLIMDMIATGSAKFNDAAGNAVEIMVPWSQGIKSTEELKIFEKVFKDKLNKHFTSEDLANSRVLVEREKAMMLGNTKEISKLVDKFFEFSTRLESSLNFGPEYQMSYWDFVGRYANMLSTEDLKYASNIAIKNLAPVRIGGKTLARKHPTLRVMEKELKKRLDNPNYEHVGNSKWQTIHQMAAREASVYVKDLFYDAAKQRQWANAWRLVFPFAQAQANTIYKWGQLFNENKVPAYRFAKSYNALQQRDSNVIYDVTGMTYDDNQGFFYKEPGSDKQQFKIPLVGNVLGAMAAKNINMSDALQITAPVQSLNLAFGQANPILPGVGPVGQFVFTASGKTAAFGPTYQVLRDIITPFGEPKNISDIVVPSWLKKAVLYRLGDQATVQRGVKDWASYLASTGDYGDNPLADDATRTRLFHDAESLSREVGMLNALFQSISPATPSTEILAKIKNPNNKMNFMTMTMLYEHWDKISQDNPGDYGKSVAQFAEAYGARNILVALGGTTSNVRGTDDAWTFLNNNPQAADKFARSPGDVVPLFFPGGEYSVKYYNWQKSSGARRPLSSTELATEAEGMIYQMLKSKIAEDQIAGMFPNYWYTQKIAELDARFGAKPPETITTGTAQEKIARVGLALNDPAFTTSPIYTEISTFYPKFIEFQKELNRVKVSNYAELSAKGGYATIMRNELVTLAETLMTQNPAFSRMYYGVFAGQLEG